MRKFTLAGLFVALAMCFSVQPLLAQTRTVFWQRWDVLIDEIDTQANQFTVTETYDVYFTGRFTFGSRVIELNNLDDIHDVEVVQGNQALRPACNEQAGTYCVSNTSDGLSIRYYFFQPINNGSGLFEIRYIVDGALRVYEGGDQLWWSAIPSDHFGFSIGSSTVTVELPPGFGPREGVDRVDTYGAPGNVQVQGTTAIAQASGTISGDEFFEIRVQYPHDPQARVPAWQANFDTQRAFEENVAPLINLGVGALSFLILLGGPLTVLGVWYTRGRDPKVGPVPTYISEPPSDLPPAIVGSLVDEKVDVRDIMSTIIDLARRGYMVMEETQESGVFGIGVNRSFTFKRTDKPLDKELRGYEKRVMKKIFSGGEMERELDSLKNKFYSVIPQVKSDLYKELVSEELFKTDPETTRKIWGVIGFGLLIAAGLLFFLIVSSVESGMASLICLPISLLIAAGTTLIVGQFMPAKTRKGAEDAAKWDAFREYLSNLEKYGTLEEASARFDEYLPYAVAFGIDRSWVKKFSRVDNMPIPYWYYPTYIGGRYHGGYTAGTPAPRADYSGMASAGDGGFSADSMANNLSGGLQSMSDGLTEMLNSASSVMTSQPQSSSSGSWSSGGGGWSGGGFSGGGSSGGGSSGFG